MKNRDLIELLQKLDPDEESIVYTGYVEEFVDRGVYETTDDNVRIQVFIKHDDDL